MEQDNIDAERRRRRALQRLGTDKPFCFCCGENDPECLELHHIAGKAFGSDLVIVCRNCHRKLTNAQKDQPKVSCVEPTMEERILHYRLGLSALLKQFAEMQPEFAAFLIEQMK
jgi:hypothetical protein